MTEVSKEIAEAVWKAADGGKTVTNIAADQLAGSLSGTSVSRLTRASKAIEKGLGDGEIAQKIGWSVQRVAQVRQWWTAYKASRSQSQKREEAIRRPQEEAPEGGSERSPSTGPAEGEVGSSASSPLRVETPVRTYQARPLLQPLYPDYKPCAWVVDAHLTNPSKTLPVGIRNMKLEITMGDKTHVLPHLGNSTEGSAGEVPFPETALPVAVRIQPVETLSGKLRFFEYFGFAGGRVRLGLVFEEAGGQIHRHTVEEFFDIPELG